MPIGAYRLNALSKFTAPVSSGRTAKTVTAFGNAQISTAQSKSGGASALFDGTGDYLQVSSSSDFAFGTGNWTIECWFRTSNVNTSQSLWDLRNNGGDNNAPLIFLLNQNLRYYEDGAERMVSGAYITAANTWYHVAVVRNGSTLTLYIDGTSRATYTTSKNHGTSYTVTIADNSFGSAYLNGYIDEFRISNTARYTANFTAPNGPFYNDANTLLLLHCNGTNGSTTFTDDTYTPVSVATVSSNVAISYVDYYEPQVVYVGPDTSNRPVFAVSFGTTNTLNTVLYRVNSDTTITEGSAQTSSLTGIEANVAIASEYEDANSFGAGSGDYIYLTYSTATITYARAAQVDRDNLTVTYGTAVNLSMDGDAGQNYCAYVGNSRSVHGSRTGVSSNLKRYSRSGTTLTNEGTTSGNTGIAIDADILGFQNNGSTQYRFGWHNQGGSANNVQYGAIALGSTNYASTNTTTSTSYSRNCHLNNTNKAMGLYYSTATSNYNARVMSITWNAASAPTVTVGTSATFTDVTGSGGNVCCSPGHSADEAYVIYNSSGSTIDFRYVSASGTTITLGQKNTGISGLSSFYYMNSATAATVGTAKYLSGFQVRSSGNVYLFAIRLTS